VISGIRTILVLLIVALVIALIGRQRFGDFFAGLRLGMDNFQKASDDVIEEIMESESDDPPKKNADLLLAILVLSALFAIAALLIAVFSILGYNPPRFFGP